MATDPSVSRAKFEREVALWQALEPHYMSRGIWLLQAKFPTVFAVLSTPNASPHPLVVCGVEIDFTDYDAQPPSVRIVNAFSRQPLFFKDIATKFHRRTLADPTTGKEEFVALLQAFEDGVPFICLPGVREYHNNPAHSGDSWLLHRATGQGTLHFILDTLWKYGAEPIVGFQLEIKQTIRVREIPL